MIDNSYQFDIAAHNKSIIKVIGVGGGGSNAVNHMYSKGIKDVEFVVVNTDLQALKNSPVPNTLQIGVNLSEGLGAGANPEKGKNAALENKEDIRELLSDGTKMIFITAGMGGGTGTGAAPVIAEVARDLEVLTVGIVTAPFKFEGRKKMRQALEGIEELKKYCDTVIIILNDRLKELFGNLPIRQAFSKADEVLATAAKSIAEIISVHAEINVDFEDVKTVMCNSGASVMGSAVTQGDARAIRAAEEAMASPLLNNNDIHGAQKILLSIISGTDAEIAMDELDEITEYITQRAGGEETEMIWGHGIDESLGDSIRVTIIATGFKEDLETNLMSANTNAGTVEKKVIDLESSKKMTREEAVAQPAPTPSREPFEVKPEKKIIGTLDMEGNDVISHSSSDAEPGNMASDTVFGMDVQKEYMVFDNQQAAQLEQQRKNELIERKKQELLQRSRERVQRFKEEGNGQRNEENYKERISVPAYVRKQKRLSDLPNSEGDISRLQLNDDNKIVGDNKFFHDNVD